MSLALGGYPTLASRDAQATTGDERPEPRHIREIWLDEERQRHVNVRISVPEPTLSEALPLLVFSAPQGFRWGGHVDYYTELAQELADRGVVMVTVRHYDAAEPMEANETFSEIYPGILTGSRNDPSVDRYEDSLFVLRRLEAINAERRPGWPVFDLERIAAGGHSSGTLTALHLCGLPVRDLDGRIFAAHRDPGIKAFVLYGYPLEYSGPSRHDLKRVGPCAGLHVAGSRDYPEYRNNSYRYIGGAPQYWLVATGDHNIGSFGSDELILNATREFISGFLLDDANARQQLSVEMLQDPQGDLKLLRRKPATGRTRLTHRDFAVWLRKHLPWGRWLHDLAIAHQREAAKATP